MGLRILIGFAEAVPAPEVIFSLRAAGYQVSVFARKAARTPVLSKLGLGTAVWITPPEDDTEAAIADIRDALTGPEAPDAIFALDDPSLWLVNAALEGSGLSVPMVNATGDQAALALNKIRQIEAARDAGIAVPQTIVAHTAEDLRSVDFLPIIVKPAMAEQDKAGKLVRGGAYYALTQGELDDLIAAPEKLMFPLLVQPLVHGVGEGVFGFATDQGVVNWMGHQRVRMMNPHGSGSSACQSLLPDEVTRAAVTKMIKDIGWRGPFMVELLRGADGTRWFMEINGRLWGSLALARRAEFEYPAWAVAQCFDGSFVPEPVAPPSQPFILRHLGREIVHLMFVLRGPKSEFHKVGWPKFWTSLKGVFAPSGLRGFYNYNPAHKAFLFADAWAVISKQLRKR